MSNTREGLQDFSFCCSKEAIGLVNGQSLLYSPAVWPSSSVRQHGWIRFASIVSKHGLAALETERSQTRKVRFYIDQFCYVRP